MNNQNEQPQLFQEWLKKIEHAYPHMSVEDREALQEWERENVNERTVNRSDWPGWDRFFGVRPDFGKSARQRFRDDRVRLIADSRNIVLLDHSPTIIVHLMPSREYDVDLLDKFDKDAFSAETLPLVFNREYSIDSNVDGYVAHAPRDQPYYACTQIFHDGKIEIVRASYFGEGRRLIHRKFEEEFLRAIQRSLVLQQQLGIPAPVLATLSVVGAAGCRITKDDSNVYAESTPIKQESDVMKMPELTITTLSPQTLSHLAVLMRGSFDRIWREAGLHKSPSYDGEGKWLKGD